MKMAMKKEIRMVLQEKFMPIACHRNRKENGWAAVTDAGNQHYRSADVMNTEAVINFTIRYREDIKPGMWVRFQGDKWNISTLGEYSFKRTYLGLKASIAKGVSG